MSTFKQDASGDLVFETGRLVLVTDPDEEVAQGIFNRFRLVLGEWFKDTRKGVPYLQKVFVRRPNLAVIRELFRRVIMHDTRVADVPTLTLTIEKETRNLVFEFEARTISGARISGGSGKPFIVETP